VRAMMGIGESHTSELFSLTKAKADSLSSEYLVKSHNHAEFTFTRAQYGTFPKSKFNILYRQ